MQQERRKKVLILEDEKTYRELVRDVLESDGFEVSEASKGRQAIEEAIKGKPDLIISDIVLPDMHGSEAIRRILNSGFCQSTPIVFISSLIGNHEKNSSALRINVDGKEYLGIPKSSGKNKILDTINEVMKN